MKKYVPLFCFWILNSLAIFLINWALPLKYVLGNAWIVGVSAAFWTGLVVTFLVWYSNEIAKVFGIRLKGRYVMFAFYFVANTAVIWLVSRYPLLFAFGISKYYWAIFLGLLLDTLQWFVWQGVKKYQ
jgi:hypothetical protein